MPKLVEDDNLTYDDCIEEWVTGISEINEIAPGVLRITYYSQRGEAFIGEEVTRRVVHHQIWHITQWTAAMLAAQDAWKRMQGTREWKHRNVTALAFN
jgi:hypothetical protein